MIKIFDFDGEKDIDIGISKRTYGGRGGKKIPIKINGNYYFIKKPNNLTKRAKRAWENIEISYNNSPISEYIGSHIYNIIGVEAHDTLLGYKDNQIVVACKDFRQDGEIIQSFGEIKVSFSGKDVNDENTNGNGSHLSSILNVIRNAEIFKEIEKDVESHFWDMFVIDFLIGNPDRNNGNWGILNNETIDHIRLTPVFDNGNSLNNLISDKQIKEILDENLLDIEFNMQPNFFVDDNEKSIKMYDLIKSKKEPKLNNSVLNIVPKINIDEIKKMINDISIISDIRKEFYITLLEKRLYKCLIPVYEELRKQ